MPLISYISIPFQTAHGLKTLRFDFANNVILANGEELIDIDEVVSDMHHFEKEKESEDVDIDLQEEMLQLLAKQLVVCSNEVEAKELSCTMCSIQNKQSNDVSCDCAK